MASVTGSAPIYKPFKYISPILISPWCLAHGCENDKQIVLLLSQINNSSVKNKSGWAQNTSTPPCHPDCRHANIRAFLVLSIFKNIGICEPWDSGVKVSL